MDGSAPKKSASLEKLVIQNITNSDELKDKLHEIITAGKSYNYDVSSSLMSLLKSDNKEILLLTVQAISELTKCEDKRETYAKTDIIVPILNILREEITAETAGIIKDGCRALGNLSCDCDTARNIILTSNGIPIAINLLEKTLQENTICTEDIKMFSSKMLLNFALGGQEYSDAVVEGGLIKHLLKILTLELEKKDMNDDMVSTALLLMSVINENTPEMMFEPEVNTAVLKVLKETANVEISELCLDHLHNQAEHDPVKILIANQKGVQLVCRRLELLVQQQETGAVKTDDEEVEAVLKQACDLVIIVLTGDDAMHILYEKGTGEVYATMVRWLDSPNPHLLTTAVLAIGNFARQDDYCAKMMNDKIFDKLLDIFETHQALAQSMQQEPGAARLVGPSTVTKILHAVLSALRNLTVPMSNKRVAATQGRAAPLLLNALPTVEDHHVAYKLLAALRMLVDGQESVAIQLAHHDAALAAVAKWGQAGEYAGAAGEAPRLIAWTSRMLKAPHWKRLLQVEGCVASLVNMLVSCHSVMQNEAILALTLLAINTLKPAHAPHLPHTPHAPHQDHHAEDMFVAQLAKSEIGKHLSVLIETNCTKMPIEVAENLLAFLALTSGKNILAMDYKQAKIHESLQKFKDSRQDFSDNLNACVPDIIKMIVEDNSMDVE